MIYIVSHIVCQLDNLYCISYCISIKWFILYLILYLNTSDMSKTEYLTDINWSECTNSLSESWVAGVLVVSV